MGKEIPAVRPIVASIFPINNLNSSMSSSKFHLRSQSASSEQAAIDTRNREVCQLSTIKHLCKFFRTKNKINIPDGDHGLYKRNTFSNKHKKINKITTSASYPSLNSCLINEIRSSKNLTSKRCGLFYSLIPQNSEELKRKNSSVFTIKRPDECLSRYSDPSLQIENLGFVDSTFMTTSNKVKCPVVKIFKPGEIIKSLKSFNKVTTREANSEGDVPILRESSSVSSKDPIKIKCSSVSIGNMIDVPAKQYCAPSAVCDSNGNQDFLNDLVKLSKISNRVFIPPNQSPFM